MEHDDDAGDVASLSKKYNDEDENEADRSGQTEEEETKWDGDKRWKISHCEMEFVG